MFESLVSSVLQKLLTNYVEGYVHAARTLACDREQRLLTHHLPGTIYLP